MSLPFNSDFLKDCRHSRDVEGLAWAGEQALRLLQQDAEAPALIESLRQVCATLSSFDLGDAPRQRALAHQYAWRVLEQHAERLPPEREFELLCHLSDEPLGEGPEAEQQWASMRARATTLWLQGWRRLEQRLEPHFDFQDVPALKVLPPHLLLGAEAREAGEACAHPAQQEHEAQLARHRQQVERYGEQFRLHRLRAPFLVCMERYLRAVYARPSFALAELEQQLDTLLPGERVSRNKAQLLKSVRSATRATSAGLMARELPLLRPKHTPVDDIPGRHPRRFGVGELIHLSFEAQPSLAAEQLGGLRWVIQSGSGTLTGASDGQALYRVGSTPGPVVLQLQVLSGPHKGQGPRLELEVVAPTGASMAQQSGTGLQHTQNTWSVGFKGEIFLTPGSVSYAGVEFSEGVVNAVATGWLSGYNGLTHQEGMSHTITGNKVNCVDTVFSGQLSEPPTYAAGDFLWAIPWRYRETGTSTWTSFTTANHHATSASTGQALIEKAGAGPFTKLPSDASSTY